MVLNGLERIPQEVRKKVEDYAEGLLDLLSGQVVSILVYGSVTGPDFNRRTSDINFAVVLKDNSLEFLKEVVRHVNKGKKHRITVPLFLTEDYIHSSMDTFPMEFMDIRDTGCVLFGKDVFSDLREDREDLRKECEYQIKGKILTIRQAYLEQATSRRSLEVLLKKAFRSLMPVLRSVYRLKSGESVLSKEELLERLGSETGVDTSSFSELLADKKNDGKIGQKKPEDFLKDLLEQLEKVSKYVDEL